MTLQVKQGGSRWQLRIAVECLGTEDDFADIQSNQPFTLNETGDQLSGGFSGGFPVVNFGRSNGCSTLEQDPLAVTVTAVAQRNASGDIVALTNLAVTTTIDGSSNGGVVCTDVELDVAGPIAATAQPFTSISPHPQSQCLRSMLYVGVQLVEVP